MITEFDTRAALLECGKEEFLKLGFEKASLRAICSHAFVTTGAFYTHFNKKEELFDAIVQDDLALCDITYDGLCDYLVKCIGGDAEDESEVIDFMIRHRTLLVLLFNRAQGTRYASFKNELFEKMENSYQALFDNAVGGEFDHDTVKTIVRMRCAQYCEILFGDYEPEQMKRIAERINVLVKAGIEALASASVAGELQR